MDISMSVPLDSDGFLRRECPACERQFKWHNGPANEEAEQAPAAVTYYCPFCGEPAGTGAWWTAEQLDHARATALPVAMQAVQGEMAALFRGTPGMTFTRGSDPDTPPSAESLAEPDDMHLVASPCHAYEPIKVPDDEAGPWHCLVCGEPFAT